MSDRTDAKVTNPSATERDVRWTALMADAQRGDRGAYRRLIDEIAPALERYCRRMFSDPAMLEDCVQEILLSVHRARHSYDPRRAFSPWLYAIARHRAIDLLRSRGTVREVPATDMLGDVAAPVEAPAESDVGEVLNGLDPKYRDAIVLTKLQGHSTRDAAAALGISEIALRTRVHRAVGKLRRLLCEVTA